MRKIAVCLVLILLASNLSAQSVTISQEKLDELTKILQTYMQATEQLSASLTSSEAQINDLQTGFTAYKQVVDLQLIPKAKSLETDVFWMKLGLYGLGILSVGEGAYMTGHALGWWK